MKNDRYAKLGLPPGNISVYKQREGRQSEIILNYIDRRSKGPDKFISKTDFDLTLLHEYLSSNYVAWLEIRGNTDLKVMGSLNEILNINSLVIEDILNSNQRPKLEVFSNQLAMFMKRRFQLPEDFDKETEQISILLFNNLVITISETYDDFFKPIKSNIQKYSEKFKELDEDFIAFSLMDYLVDTYIIQLQYLEEEIEEIEEAIDNNQFDRVKEDIYALRRRNLGLRKVVVPLRDIAISLRKVDIELFSDEVKTYLRDLNDHILLAIDTVELNRDIITSLRENYVSELSHRMNEIMFTLTIISTIILPLTFLTSLYGMNFVNIPELSWEYGYFALWGVMLVLASSLLFLFRRRGWL